jgi:hypothetical protein
MSLRIMSGVNYERHKNSHEYSSRSSGSLVYGIQG